MAGNTQLGAPRFFHVVGLANVSGLTPLARQAWIAFSTHHNKCFSFILFLLFHPPNPYIAGNLTRDKLHFVSLPGLGAGRPQVGQGSAWYEEGLPYFQGGPWVLGRPSCRPSWQGDSTFYLQHYLPHFLQWWAAFVNYCPSFRVAHFLATKSAAQVSIHI